MDKSYDQNSFRINFISLNCHLPVNQKGRDQVFLKYEDKRLYPKKGKRYLQFNKGEAHKFEDLSVVISNADKVQTIMVELWKKSWLFKNTLVGRFFFITNISEIGFSATQLIRNSEYHQSNYLLHWEKRSLDPTKDMAKLNEKQPQHVK